MAPGCGRTSMEPSGTISASIRCTQARAAPPATPTASRAPALIPDRRPARQQPRTVSTAPMTSAMASAPDAAIQAPAATAPSTEVAKPLGPRPVNAVTDPSGGAMPHVSSQLTPPRTARAAAPHVHSTPAPRRPLRIPTSSPPDCFAADVNLPIGKTSICGEARPDWEAVGDRGPLPCRDTRHAPYAHPPRDQPLPLGHPPHALGAAPDDLREALITARTRFEDVVAQGRRADWFMAEERRETGRKVEDLIGRRTDQTLRQHLTQVAQAWDQAFAHAPGAAGPMVRWSNHVPTPQEREESGRVQMRFGKASDVARTGLEHIKAALTRLDEPERRAHGR
jgi:hypothetical protein